MTGGKRGALHLWQVPDTDAHSAAAISQSEVGARMCCLRMYNNFLQ